MTRYPCYSLLFGVRQQYQNVCKLFPLAQRDDKIGRITAKRTSYRVVFDLFSIVCKKTRLNLCRKINLVRHETGAISC